MMQNYQILGNVGEGSFGRVFRAVEKSTGKVYALKFIPKVGHSESDISTIRRECEIQQNLSHPNVVRMVKYFETESEVVAVTEFAEGVLFDLFEPGQRRLPEIKVRNVALQLLSAMYYLHSNRILHRDVKPQNVLLGANGVIKVCDFGFAKVLDIHTYVLTSVKGTPLYMAPEVIEEKPYDQGADLWSVGCILYELLVGAPPFCTGSLVQLVRKIRHEAIIWPTNISDLCLNFLQGLLEKDQRRRFSWQNILDHPFVAGGILILAQDGSLPINPLTNPLTPSQELAKEIQRQDLFQKAPLRTRFLSGVSHHVPNERRNSAPLQRGLPHLQGMNRPVDPLGAMALQRRNTTAQYGGFEPRNNLIMEPMRFNFPYQNVNNFQICTAQQNIEEMREFSHRINEKMISKNLSCLNLSEKPVLKAIGFDSSHRLATEGEELKELKVEAVVKSDPEAEDVENEEWTGFLDEALSDALDSIDSLLNKSVLQMFTSPLKSKNLSAENLERIITLLILPLMSDSTKRNEALQFYLDLQIIPSILFAADCQLKNCEEERTTCMSSVESVLNLVSHLCHCENSNGFLNQLKELLCLPNGQRVFKEAVSCSNFSKESKHDVLSVLVKLYKTYNDRTVITEIVTEGSLLNS